MKKSYIFFLFVICSLSPSLLLAQGKAFNKTWTTGNPFKTDVFIENFGQYNNLIKSSDVIKYALNNSEKIFFLPNGIIYRLDVIENIKKDEQEKDKKGEKEEDDHHSKLHSYYVKMQWEGCNENAKTEASEAGEGYYTFGEKGYANVKAKGFKKITYKDLYPGIDVEYTIPEKGGIKYKLIVHAGADIGKVKMNYSGDFEKIKKDNSGNILIKTPAGNIIDHLPESFYEENKTQIPSEFEINNNIISFKLNELQTLNSKPQTIIIDPWTVVPTTLISDNAAYDIASDDYGNVWVAGGTTTGPYYMAKYSAIGNLLWTFTNPSDWSSSYFCYSKFCILPHTGTTFMGEGLNESGPRVMKISPGGTLAVISPNLPPNNEIWEMFYNRCTGQLIAFGGGTATDDNIHIIADTNLTSGTSSDFNTCASTDNDIASAIIDYNGDFYSLMSSQVCSNNNDIMKSLISTGYAPPPAFDVNTGYNFYECENDGIPGLGGACGMGCTVRANSLALTSDFLYSYDGLTLKAWNKGTGGLLGSIVVDPTYAGGMSRTHEGIAVDGCNNVYVGGTNKVHEFSFSGSTFTPVTIYTTNVTNEVYDISLDITTDILYVCGLGFVSIFPVTSCAVSQLTISANADSCINAATVTVSSGTPPFSYLWSNGSITNTISGVPPGTYFVTVTDNSCIRQKGIDTVTLNAPYIMHISNDTTICFGSSVALSATGAHSYVWSPSTGLSSVTDSTVTAMPNDTITYTVTATFPNGCTASLPVTVNITNIFSINVGHDTTICAGDSALLHAGGGSLFTWSPIGTLNNPSISNPIAHPTSTTTYYVTVSNGGCGLKDSVKVLVNPVPNLIVTNSTICKGQTDTLFAAGAISYVWNDGSTNSSIIVSPTSTTVYTVTGTSLGCKVSATGTITVNPVPNAQISPFTPTTCGLNNGTATATGGTTYLWSNSQTTATVTGLAPGNYTVTVSDSIGCFSTAGVTINLIPTVTVALLSIDSVKCFGQANGSISINASSGTPGYNYVWNTLPVQTSATATGLNIGTYTCTVTDANGCRDSLRATVYQPLLLTSVVASADTILKCYGMNNGYINLAVAGGTPSYSYHWNTGATSTSINSLPGGTYTVTVTDRNGCSVTTSVTITQPPDLVLSISSFTNVSCFGGSDGSAIVNVTGGVTPYASYNWDDGETTATAVNLSPGVHSVTVTDANGCSKTITVTITQPSKINIIATTDSVKCYGQANGSISLNVTGGTPVFLYLWNTGSGSSIASNLTAGTYTCLVTDANGCKDSIKATVLQPTQLISTVTNADTILPCWGLNNGTITIAVVGGSRPWTFLWNTGATGMTINNLTGGTYTDTITDSKGCRNIHTVVVTQPTQLFVQMDSIPVSCLNNCDGQLTSAVTGGTPWHGTGGLTIYHYLWNTVPPQNTESITGLCEGTYNLTITDSNGCSRIISEYIGVNDSVVANLVAAPTTGYIPLDVNFIYTGTSSSANSYTWNFGDGGISSLENPTHLYTTADTFSVWLYITNGICKDSIHIFVYPEIPSLLIVPNVFTPNGDGYNDEFMVKYQNIKTFNCMIFDRWGKKIYEWSDVTKGWDGKTKAGAESSDGTYFYILSAEGVDGIKYNDHGTVTLLR